MLLQILGTLEGLAAEVALVRLQWDVNTDVRSDVVTLDRGGAAVTPLAGQVEVVGALAADMALTDMVLGAGHHISKGPGRWWSRAVVRTVTCDR